MPRPPSLWICHLLQRASGRSSLAVLGLCLFAASARAEPRVEKIAFSEDGRIVALLDADGAELSVPGFRIYHEGELVIRFGLDAAPDGRYRLAFRAPRLLGRGIHHELVLTHPSLPASAPIVTEFIEGREIVPAGLDSRGVMDAELSPGASRVPLALLLAVVVVGGGLLWFWLRSGKKRASTKKRVCSNCNEVLEPGFTICPYCTYPGTDDVFTEPAADPVPTPKERSDVTTEPLLQVTWPGAGDELDEPPSPREESPRSWPRKLPREAPGPVAQPEVLEDEPVFEIGPSPLSSGRAETDPELQKTTVLEKAPSLQVVDGQNQGHRYPVRANDILVGRSAVCDIVLDAPRVQPRHARITYERGAYWIEALNREEGLELNGRWLPRGRLHYSDHVTIGSVTLLFLPD